MAESEVGNLNVSAVVHSKNDPQSETTGAKFHMDSGASINQLNMTIYQHTYGHPSALTEVELFRCRDDLRSYYKTNCKIRLLPWLKRDPRNRLEMKDLFINLYLLYEMPNAFDIEVRINKYSDVFPLTPGEGMRTIIRGKAGAGKTTLLEKLALEWAEGSLPPTYSDKPLLFLLKMKHITSNDTLVDAVFRQGLFGRNIQKLKSKLNVFIEDNPKKIILLLDAVDEYSGYGSNGQLDSIIHNDSMKCAFVIVTTRPWRAFEILDRSPDTYSSRNYEVKGYSQEQVRGYVSRFFEKKSEMGECLLKQLKETGLDTGIATIPIMCMLICALFRKRKSLPKTMSKIYKALYDYFIQHYDEDKNDSTKVCKNEQLDTFKKLGKLAFSGLMQNKLIFEKNEFVDVNLLSNAYKMGLVLQSNPNIMSDNDAETKTPVSEEGEESDYYDFFHKTFQEWFGARYLADKDIVAFKHLCEPVFTDINSCLDKELLLVFLSGENCKVAGLVTSELVRVLLNCPYLGDYNENKLALQKTRSMQEFIELVLKCNRESQSQGSLNDLLNKVFEKQCCARFTNITTSTLQAITYMLKFGGATNNCESQNESSSADCMSTFKLRIEDLKISCFRAETNGDIDNLWGEFHAVGEQHKEKCKNLSILPNYKLQSYLEEVKDDLPEGVQHLPLAHKLAFADTCKFIQKWKGDYTYMGCVVENICFSEITNLTINGIDMSDHCEILCKNLENMKSLKKVDLCSTSLKVMHCRYIGKMLESLPCLCVLNLYENMLEDVREIVQRLEYIRCLTRLDLDVTNLTTESIAALAQNLKWVKNLERLYIRSSSLENSVVDDLVNGLNEICDLRRLSITLGDELSYENINILVKCLSKIRNLELAYIDGLFSPMINKVFQLLVTDLLPHLKKLKSLRLQGRYGLSVKETKRYGISNATAKLLATKLNTGSLPNLMVLRLTYLWIEEEGLEAISSGVRRRKQENKSFQFELYPNDNNSVYVPQAVLLTNLNTDAKKDCNATKEPSY
ncbi:NLR family CARD domain-containing protein 4-like isoform X2 [Anneissia japonica]|nr:NLR family CARD domain-containing protein 4-like isoform X2 [Anneissia japonica]